MDFIPNKKWQQKNLPKAAVRTVPGIFLGYSFNDEGRFRQKYRICPLCEFEASGIGLPKGKELEVQTVSDLVLRPNQKTWQFPLRDARRKYTTTISDPAVTTDGWIGNDHPGESLQDLTIRFLEAEEDGEVGESSRHDAQQDRNSGQASHPVDDLSLIHI